jgi:hypothetical protein
MLREVGNEATKYHWFSITLGILPLRYVRNLLIDKNFNIYYHFPEHMTETIGALL